MDSNVEIAAPLVGDIGSCVAALLDGMGGDWPAPPADWTGAVKAKREENIARMAPRLMNNNSPMDYHSALGVLRDVIKERPDAILVNEGANTLDLARGVIDMYQPRKRLDVGTWGVMGIGMGFAIAAADRDRQAGARHRRRQRVRLLRHGGGDDLPLQPAGLRRRLQQRRHLSRQRRQSGGGADPATTVFVKGARYDKMMEGFGGVGVNATTPDELKRAVDAAMDSGKPDADQRGDRPGGRQRERQHRQSQPAKRAEQEITSDGGRSARSPIAKATTEWSGRCPKHSTASASSTSPTCSRGRPARSFSPGSAPT